MTLRESFFGSPEVFEARIRSLGIKGTFEKQPNGVWHFRTIAKAGIHWSSTRGTIWCDGKAPAKRIFEQKLEEAFGDQVTLEDPVPPATVVERQGPVQLEFSF